MRHDRWLEHLMILSRKAVVRRVGILKNTPKHPRKSEKPGVAGRHHFDDGLACKLDLLERFKDVYVRSKRQTSRELWENER